jgi:dihydroorotase
MRLLIKDGCVIDPSQNVGSVADVLVVDGRIAEITTSLTSTTIDPKIPGTQVIDAAGCFVAPGFVDMHCHLRQPGEEDKETVATGTQAAARGGFTLVCAMPNTTPPPDSAAGIYQLQQLAAREGVVRVLPVGTITKGRAGQELTEMAELQAAGAVAFSDDGAPVESSRLMRHALLYSTLTGLPILSHCEDRLLSQDADMHEGPISTMLGLRGYPAAAETHMVGREIALAELTGGHLHVCHVSTAGAVQLIREAKSRGVHVTAEVTPHHLTMTDAWVAGSLSTLLDLADSAPLLPVPPDFSPYNTHTKVNPPLRTRADLEALWEGLRDCTIDAIATDHAPHTWVDKECEYALAASGISGLETALGLLLALSHHNVVDLSTLVGALACNPARILGLPYGTLQVGQPADMAIFNPEEEWRVKPEEMASKGKNTPLAGVTLRGRVHWTLLEGRAIFGPDPIPGDQYKPRATASRIEGLLGGTGPLRE